MKIAEAANDVIEGYAIMGKRPFKVRRFSQIAGKLWMGGFPVGQAPEDLQFVVNLHPAIGYGMHPKQILTCAIFMDGEELPEEKLLYLLARHVNECRQHGTTLVHCQMGLLRFHKYKIRVPNNTSQREEHQHEI